MKLSVVIWKGMKRKTVMLLVCCLDVIEVGMERRGTVFILLSSNAPGRLGRQDEALFDLFSSVHASHLDIIQNSFASFQASSLSVGSISG